MKKLEDLVLSLFKLVNLHRESFGSGLFFMVMTSVIAMGLTGLSEGKLLVLVVLFGVPDHESLLLNDNFAHLRVLLLVNGVGDNFVVGDDHGNQDDHHDNKHKSSSDPVEGPCVLFFHPLSLGLLYGTQKLITQEVDPFVPSLSS